MRFLVAGLVGVFYAQLIGQAAPGAPPSWDELGRTLLNSIIPFLVGALVHWIGALHGARTMAKAMPPPPSEAASTP